MDNNIRLKTVFKRYLKQELDLGQDEVAVERSRMSGRTPSDAVDMRSHSNGRAAHLEQYKNTICTCQKCHLGKTRIRFVFGVGNPCAKLLFVGEGPGYAEDRKGEPFVGAAGKLLDKMIAAIGMSRETVYIANIVKCHPMKDPAHSEQRGNDRPPNDEEITTCLPYLHEQIRIIRPKVICTLGACAVRALMYTEQTITRIRGKEFNYNGILLIPIFHPAALLRNPSLKKDTWADLQKVRDAINN